MMDTQLASHAVIEKQIFDDIALGDTASLVRTLTQDDVDLFAIVSGNVKPSHFDAAFAASGKIPRLISAVLGTSPAVPTPGAPLMVHIMTRHV